MGTSVSPCVAEPLLRRVAAQLTEDTLELLRRLPPKGDRTSTGAGAGAGASEAEEGRTRQMLLATSFILRARLGLRCTGGSTASVTGPGPPGPPGPPRRHSPRCLPPMHLNPLLLPVPSISALSLPGIPMTWRALSTRPYERKWEWGIARWRGTRPCWCRSCTV